MGVFIDICMAPSSVARNIPLPVSHPGLSATRRRAKVTDSPRRRRGRTPWMSNGMSYGRPGWMQFGWRMVVPWRIAGESYSYAAFGSDLERERAMLQPFGREPNSHCEAPPANRDPCHSPTCKPSSPPVLWRPSSASSQKFIVQERANVPRLGASADLLQVLLSSAQVWRLQWFQRSQHPSSIKENAYKSRLPHHDIPTNTPIAKFSHSLLRPSLHTYENSKATLSQSHGIGLLCLRLVLDDGLDSSRHSHPEEAV
ncbi:hypothetical protein BDZ45DRAFT_311689 [Acephala macrosclerotiorum]|nr:hypothetical protein BDZ45DRAFT_311689 [Acephala macrosclerotiorum]